MTSDRQISVYAGQTLLGFVVERADKSSCIAKDANGKKLGSFPSLQRAADAISEAGNAQAGEVHRLE